MCWNFNALGLVRTWRMSAKRFFVCVSLVFLISLCVMCELTERSYTLLDLHYCTHANKVLLNKKGDWFCYSNLKFLEMKIIF